MTLDNLTQIFDQQIRTGANTLFYCLNTTHSTGQKCMAIKTVKSDDAHFSGLLPALEGFEFVPSDKSVPQFYEVAHA